MTKKFGIGSGTISLVVIFSVLCLVIFALLTLTTARADLSLSNKSAMSQINYYQADTKATEILAKLLQSTDEPDEIDGIPIHYQGDKVSYSVEIDSSMSLYVDYSMPGGNVLAWKSAPTTDWVPDENIDVWQGDDFMDMFGDLFGS